MSNEDYMFNTSGYDVTCIQIHLYAPITIVTEITVELSKLLSWWSSGSVE